MSHAQRKSLRKPEEVRSFPYGSVSLVSIGETTRIDPFVMRLIESFEPLRAIRPLDAQSRTFTSAKPKYR